VETTTRYQMVLRFVDADSSTGWRNSDVHQALQPALRTLYADSEVRGYDVIG
jgi:heme-degrading monooxygenase HmoA